MTSKHVLTGLILCLCCSAAAIGQPTVRTMAPTMEARLEALEKQNAALATQVTQLQSQLAQAKTDNDKNFFNDRFRIGALEANNKVSPMGNLQSQLAALTQKFQTHTHGYHMTTFGFANGQLTNQKIGNDAPIVQTEPPK